MIFHVMLLFYCFLLLSRLISPSITLPLRSIYVNQAATNYYVYHHIFHAPLFFSVKLQIPKFSHTFTSFTLILNNDIKKLSFTKYAKDCKIYIYIYMQIQQLFILSIISATCFGLKCHHLFEQ
jgi:hypothetical protein